MKRKSTASAAADNLRQRAEQLLAQRPATALDGEMDIQRLQHELHVSQIQLELQGEELRAAQRQIELSWALYQNLYDYAPVGYLALDKTGRVLGVNLTGAAWLQMDRHAMIGQLFSEFMDDANRQLFWRYLSEIFRDGTSLSVELQLRAADNMKREVLMVSAAVEGNERKSEVAHTTMFDITERKIFDKRLKAIAFETAMVEEKERRNLAQDLHDDLGQLIAVARIKLAALESDDHNDMQSHKLREIDDLLARANKSIHSLAFQLRPPMLDDLGLVAALHWLAGEIKSLYGLEVKVHDDGKPKPLDHQANIVLFRAARELLVNAAKHAEVSTAELRIRRAGDVVQLEVSDEGKGFDHSALVDGLHSAGFGLLNIKERIRQIGGTAVFITNPGEGTRVTLTLPLPEQTAISREVVK